MLNIQQIKTQSNGSVRISLNSSLSRDFTKSTSDLTEDYDSFSIKRPGSNKIMINVNQDKTFNLTSKNSFGKKSASVIQINANQIYTFRLIGIILLTSISAILHLQIM